MIVFLFFPENRIWHYMQIISLRDSLHEMSNLFSGKNKKKYFKMLSAENFTHVQSMKSPPSINGINSPSLVFLSFRGVGVITVIWTVPALFINEGLYRWEMDASSREVTRTWKYLSFLGGCSQKKEFFCKFWKVSNTLEATSCLEKLSPFSTLQQNQCMQSANYTIWVKLLRHLGRVFLDCLKKKIGTVFTQSIGTTYLS